MEGVISAPIFKDMAVLGEIPDWRILREVILIGIPSFLQLSGYSVSILIVNVFLKKYSGDLGLSTYGIVSKINTLLLFPITGLAQGIQPIIGYNQGAGKNRRVKETLGKAYRIATGYSVLHTVSFCALRQLCSVCSHQKMKSLIRAVQF